MTGLRFVEETHQYFLAFESGGGELELPALTDILKSVGIIDDRWYSKYPEAAERGKKIHLALAHLDGPGLDWGTVEESFFPYIEAYSDFLIQENFTIQAIESPIYHKDKLFAGTPDRVITTDRRIILDIKTGGRELWHELQLTGYADALQSHDEPADELWCVYLRDNGKYTLKRHPVDFEIWNHVWAVYRWLNQKG